jgi:hypothetical protein
VQWEWDPNRQQYYWYSASEKAWIYENGDKVFPNGEEDAETDKSVLDQPKPKVSPFPDLSQRVDASK